LLTINNFDAQQFYLFSLFLKVNLPISKTGSNVKQNIGKLRLTPQTHRFRPDISLVFPYKLARWQSKQL
jgi:hypothetical protein